MSSPNPNYDVGQLRPGFEPGTFIPAWYKDHSDKDVQVKLEGVPCGFTVKEVMPERRWAIQENGELLEQHIFERQFIQWISLFHAGDNISDPSKEAIPSALKFVNRKLDHNGKGIAIGFDPNKPAEEEAKPIYNQDGEISKHSLEQSNKIARLQTLMELQADGLLTADEYAAKTKLLLLEEEEHKFATQDPIETQAEAKEEELLTEERAPKVRAIEQAPCGKSVKSGYVNQHMSRCKNPECNREQ